MRHLHGLSLAEIAEAMGKTPPAVAGLIRRGISTLRESLADETI
jgi:DNA-directed RNA polymerase specialized sigma24 family protein